MMVSSSVVVSVVFIWFIWKGGTGGGEGDAAGLASVVFINGTYPPMHPYGFAIIILTSRTGVVVMVVFEFEFKLLQIVFWNYYLVWFGCC